MTDLSNTKLGSTTGRSMSNADPLLYAYLGSLLLPPAVLAVDRLVLARPLGNLKAAALSAVLIFTVIVGTAFLYGRHLDRLLAAFDLDGDGIFSGEELSPDQDRALRLVTNDLSRTLAPVTGGLVAIVYAGSFFTAVAAVSRVGRRASGAA